MIKKVETDKAPKAIGPYSPAIVAGDYVFVSGQIPLDPVTGQIVQGGVKEQTEQVLSNLRAILDSVQLNFTNVVKTTIFLKNMSDFSVVNEVYASKFVAEPKPARETVEVSKLPKDVLIEISCIAYLN